MADIVDNYVQELYSKWVSGIQDTIGANNYLFGASENIARTPYATFVPLPDAEYMPATDLENDENGLTIGVQISSYGSKATEAYAYDTASRQVMRNLGFRCLTGRTYTRNDDIHCVISRFTMNYFGEFSTLS